MSTECKNWDLLIFSNNINYTLACGEIPVSFVLQVAVLIDTSASMASRLFLVKDKLYRLMQVGVCIKGTIHVHVGRFFVSRSLQSFAEYPIKPTF